MLINENLHLVQKYRMHRRNILPKEDDRRWVQPRDQTQRSYYVQKPIMAYPPYHSSPATAAGPVYPIWGATTGSPHGVQMWGSIGYPQWQATESWHWKPYAGVSVHESKIQPLVYHNELMKFIWLALNNKCSSHFSDACGCMGLSYDATATWSFSHFSSSEYYTNPFSLKCHLR